MNRSKYKKWRSRIILFLMIFTILYILFARKSGHDDYRLNPKIIKAQQDILRVQRLLELFKKDNLYYPITDEGLEALVNNPDPEKYLNHKSYIQRLPIDPWGKQYQYLSPGSFGDYDIYSLGSDGVQSDDDIGSWELGK